MKSHGSTAEKNTHSRRVQMRWILLTNEAWRWNLLVWLSDGQGPKRRAPESRMAWANSALACSDCLTLTSWAWQSVLYGEKLVRLGGWPYNHEMVIPLEKYMIMMMMMMMKSTLRTHSRRWNPLLNLAATERSKAYLTVGNISFANISKRQGFSSSGSYKPD